MVVETDTSLLPSPAQPVEMKVFHGGGGDMSILPSPPTEVPLTEFRGGGLSKMEGGEKESEVASFRGMAFEQLHELFPDNLLLLRPVYDVEKETFEKEEFNKIPVFPVLFSEDSKAFLKEDSSFPNKLFFGVDGKEFTSDSLWKSITEQTAKYYPVLFSKNLTPEKPLFTQTTTEELKKLKPKFFPKPQQTTSVTPVSPETSEQSEFEPRVPHAHSKVLSNGLRIRDVLYGKLINDSLKQDIQNLRFTPNELTLFKTIFNFEHKFVRNWILSSEENKERFFEFWKTYTKFNDFENALTYRTKKEGQQIQNFLNTILESYTQFLLTQASKFLIDSDVGIRDMKKEEMAALLKPLPSPKEKEISIPSEGAPPIVLTPSPPEVPKTMEEVKPGYLDIRDKETKYKVIKLFQKLKHENHNYEAKILFTVLKDIESPFKYDVEQLISENKTVRALEIANIYVKGGQEKEDYEELIRDKYSQQMAAIPSSISNLELRPETSQRVLDFLLKLRKEKRLKDLNDLILLLRDTKHTAIKRKVEEEIGRGHTEIALSEYVKNYIEGETDDFYKNIRTQLETSLTKSYAQQNAQMEQKQIQQSPKIKDINKSVLEMIQKDIDVWKIVEYLMEEDRYKKIQEAFFVGKQGNPYGKFTPPTDTLQVGQSKIYEPLKKLKLEEIGRDNFWKPFFEGVYNLDTGDDNEKKKKLFTLFSTITKPNFLEKVKTQFPFKEVVFSSQTPNQSAGRRRRKTYKKSSKQISSQSRGRTTRKVHSKRKD